VSPSIAVDAYSEHALRFCDEREPDGNGAAAASAAPKGGLGRSKALGRSINPCGWVMGDAGGAAKPGMGLDGLGTAWAGGNGENVSYQMVGSIRPGTGSKGSATEVYPSTVAELVDACGAWSAGGRYPV
jgi:hypothetical protein